MTHWKSQTPEIHLTLYKSPIYNISFISTTIFLYPTVCQHLQHKHTEPPSWQASQQVLNEAVSFLVWKWSPLFYIAVKSLLTSTLTWDIYSLDKPWVYKGLTCNIKVILKLLVVLAGIFSHTVSVMTQEYFTSG